MAAHATLLTVTPMLPAGPSLSEAVQYYVAHLGFSVLWQDGGMAAVRRGQVEFHLVENADRHWAENTSLSLGVTGLDALYAEYQATTTTTTTVQPPAPVTVLGPLEVKAWGRREFHMILPSGVCLQFYEASS